MKRWRLFVCALALLGAGPPGSISLRTLDGDEAVIERGPAGPDWVLHFWATWCPECVEELPELALAARGCGDECGFEREHGGRMIVGRVRVGEVAAHCRLISH